MAPGSCKLQTSCRAPGRKWDDLDAAFAKAVLGVAKGPLKREILLYGEEQIRKGHPLSGRAASWHVHQRYKLDGGEAMCVDLSTLMGMTFQSDLEGFLAAWDYTLLAPKKTTDE